MVLFPNKCDAQTEKKNRIFCKCKNIVQLLETAIILLKESTEIARKHSLLHICTKHVKQQLSNNSLEVKKAVVLVLIINIVASLIRKLIDALTLMLYVLFSMYNNC